MPEDENEQVSAEIRGVHEETNVLIVDKIIKISEVTCEKIDTDKSANQENTVHVHNPVPIEDSNGKNSKLDPSSFDKINLPCVSEVVDKLTPEGQSRNDQHLSEKSQVITYVC